MSADAGRREPEAVAAPERIDNAGNAEIMLHPDMRNSLNQEGIAGMAGAEPDSMPAVSSKSVTISSLSAPSYIPAIHPGPGGLASMIGGNGISPKTMERKVEVRSFIVHDHPSSRSCRSLREAGSSNILGLR